MEINKDKEIIEELQNITKNKKEINKTKKRMKFAMISILICNFLAGCFMCSIFIILNDIIYLIIGIIVILLNIPAYLLLNKIIKKIEEYGSKNTAL